MAAQQGRVGEGVMAASGGVFIIAILAAAAQPDAGTPALLKPAAASPDAGTPALLKPAAANPPDAGAPAPKAEAVPIAPLQAGPDIVPLVPPPAEYTLQLKDGDWRVHVNLR